MCFCNCRKRNLPPKSPGRRAATPIETSRLGEKPEKSQAADRRKPADLIRREFIEGEKFRLVRGGARNGMRETEEEGGYYNNAAKLVAGFEEMEVEPRLERLTRLSEGSSQRTRRLGQSENTFIGNMKQMTELPNETAVLMEEILQKTMDPNLGKQEKEKEENEKRKVDPRSLSIEKVYKEMAKNVTVNPRHQKIWESNVKVKRKEDEEYKKELAKQVRKEMQEVKLELGGDIGQKNLRLRDFHKNLLNDSKHKDRQHRDDRQTTNDANTIDNNSTVHIDDSSINRGNSDRYKYDSMIKDVYTHHSTIVDRLYHLLLYNNDHTIEVLRIDNIDDSSMYSHIDDSMKVYDNKRYVDNDTSYNTSHFDDTPVRDTSIRYNNDNTPLRKDINKIVYDHSEQYKNDIRSQTKSLHDRLNNHNKHNDNNDNEENNNNNDDYDNHNDDHKEEDKYEYINMLYTYMISAYNSKHVSYDMLYNIEHILSYICDNRHIYPSDIYDVCSRILPNIVRCRITIQSDDIDDSIHSSIGYDKYIKDKMYTYIQDVHSMISKHDIKHRRNVRFNNRAHDNIQDNIQSYKSHHTKSVSSIKYPLTSIPRRHTPTKQPTVDRKVDDSNRGVYNTKIKSHTKDKKRETVYTDNDDKYIASDVHDDDASIVSISGRIHNTHIYRLPISHSISRNITRHKVDMKKIASTYIEYKHKIRYMKLLSNDIVCIVYDKINVLYILSYPTLNHIISIDTSYNISCVCINRLYHMDHTDIVQKNMMVCDDEGYVSIHSLYTYDMIVRYQLHSNSIVCITDISYGKGLISVDTSGILRIWNVKDKYNISLSQSFILYDILSIYRSLDIHRDRDNSTMNILYVDDEYFVLLYHSDVYLFKCYQSIVNHLTIECKCYITTVDDSSIRASSSNKCVMIYTKSMVYMYDMHSDRLSSVYRHSFDIDNIHTYIRDSNVHLLSYNSGMYVDSDILYNIHIHTLDHHAHSYNTHRHMYVYHIHHHIYTIVHYRMHTIYIDVYQT